MTQQFTFNLPDGQQTVTVEVNFEQIANKIGMKAIKSKSGKAVSLGGAVKVTHARTTKREDERHASKP